MTISIHHDPVPLRVDDNGTVRVGGTRITLDVLLSDYRRGMTPEQIVEQMDSLALADVYGALAYYHRHRDELDAYLQCRAEEAGQRQRQIEATHPSFEEVKSRILSRRSSVDASASE